MSAKSPRQKGSLRKMRPAFLITGSLLWSAACAQPTTPKNDVPPGAARDLPLKDARGHSIFRQGGGGCYVQVPRKGDPPADFMSGEKWVDDEAVECPEEFADPAFAAVPDGSILGQSIDGTCYIYQTYGNPPPPAVDAPCPAFAKKADAKPTTSVKKEP